MNKSPRVSVVITNYNYGNYLKEAIDSVLLQVYENIELIVIDDGSTDNSREVAATFGDTIKYIYQENSGVISTRNKGIRNTSGEFILFLDADDKLEPHYVENLVETAISHVADIVYTDVKKFGSSNKISNFPDFNIEILKNKNIIHISSLIRRSIIGDVLFDSRMTNMTHEDWDFFLSLCVRGAVVVKSSEVFLHYRIHDSSRNNIRKTNEEKRKYIDTYRYIISKHKKSDESFSYISGFVFAKWYAELDDEVCILKSNHFKDDIVGVRASLRLLWVALREKIN